MIDHRKSLSLMCAGVISAVGIFYLLTIPSLQTDVNVTENPVAIKTLKEAKNQQKKGRLGKAARLLEKFATIDHPKILLEFARMQARGLGIPQDLESARVNLLLAVQQEFPDRGYAAYELAWVYERSTGDDCTRIAYEWYTKAAEWGFTKAHAELGRMAAQGLGVAVDLHKALAHYQAGAKTGSARAMLKFIRLVQKRSDLHESMPDIDAMAASVIPLLEDEAFSGNAASAKALGRLYLDGGLLPVDLMNAELWLRRSVRLGDIGAMAELATLLLRDRSNQQIVQQAKALLDHAVSLQHSGAMTELGRLYLDPDIELDRAKAAELFKLAAKARHAGGMLELARLHLAGDLVPKDDAFAIDLLKKGAAAGHKGSITLLKSVETGDIEANLLKSNVPGSHNALEAAALKHSNIEPQFEIIRWQVNWDKSAPSTKTDFPKKPMTGATFVSRIEKRG